MFKKLALAIMVLLIVSCSAGDVQAEEVAQPVVEEVAQVVLEESESEEIAFEITPADCDAVAQAMAGADNDFMMFADGAFMISYSDPANEITFIYSCDTESGAEAIQVIHPQSVDVGALRTILAQIDDASQLHIIEVVDGGALLDVAGQTTYLTQVSGMWNLVIATVVE